MTSSVTPAMWVRRPPPSSERHGEKLYVVQTAQTSRSRHGPRPFARLKVWELLCAGSRRSAGLHARVTLDGAACRLSELGDVRDVLSVLVVW